MRAVLVDWLVDVHLKYKMSPETLFLTINLLDRYLSVSEYQIPREKLQLIGTTCLMIACKYEEIYPPKVKEFVVVTASTYTIQELL